MATVNKRILKRHNIANPPLVCRIDFADVKDTLIISSSHIDSAPPAQGKRYILENTALNTENGSNHQLLRTPLWNLHKALNAKMVEFAGYEMPIQYPDGVLAEHLHTRNSAGLFDVSHMGQAILSASDDPARALEKIVPGDITGLAAGKMRYTLLLNDKGGIIDDLMVTRLDDYRLFIVVNAACKEKDYAYIQKMLPETRLERLDDRALIALQGPKAESVMEKVIPNAATLSFMSFLQTGDIFVTRSGYTGEDGFEISVPADQANDMTKKLLVKDIVQPIGLGARDSLRLEAGLCLYGHDLDDTTTPVEANLKWVIGKNRRETGGFIGDNIILEQLKSGCSRLRVGIKPEGRAPVREGCELVDDSGQKIGIVTSGGYAPSLESPVAMGYIDPDHAKTGTQIKAVVRGTEKPCEVVTMPFITPNYKRG